jgi:phage terminase small subunit
MASRGCTPKQEEFARIFVETGNATEAYRQVYQTKPDAKLETLVRNAFRVTETPVVAARIAEIRADIARRHRVTEDSLIAELEEARILARDNINPATMVSATMGKAKICGLDRQVIEHTGNVGVTQITRRIVDPANEPGD